MAITDPRDIPDLLVWYSAEAVTGLSSGSGITTLTDLSGNGNDATSDGVDAIWYSTGGPSSGPRIHFPPGGGGQTGLALPASLMAGKASGEAMATIKVDNTGVENSHWRFGTTSQNSHFPFSNGLVYDEFGTDTRKDNITPGVALTSWRRYNTWSAAGDWAARFDGTTVFSAATNTVAWRSDARIGAQGGFSHGGSDYGCFLLYGRKLTTTERNDLDAWLTANPAGGNTTILPRTFPVATASETEAAQAALVTRDGARYYQNFDASGLRQIKSTTAETIVDGMDAVNLTGASTAVTINVAASMNAVGTPKTLVFRLRDGGLTGTILASATKNAAVDSTAGNDAGLTWSHSGTYAPANGRLCVTAEVTAGPAVVYSAARTFDVIQDRLSSTVAVGQVAETDSAQPLTVALGGFAATVGQVAETDSAATITPFVAGAMAAVGQAAETDTAQAFTVALGVITVPLGQATETDTAVGWTFTQPATVTIGQASETDTAGTVGVTGMYGVAAAEESDEALAVLVVQAPLRNGIGLALDSSAVLTVEAALEPEPTVPAGTPPTVLHIIAPTAPVPTLVAGRPQ